MSDCVSNSFIKSLEEYHKKRVEPRYYYDLTTIKQYRKNNYKVCTIKTGVLRKGQKVYRMPKNSVNTKKLDNNLVRAKTTIKEYALCNDFEYFVTLTLDKQKYNRYDLKKYIKDLGQFIRDYRKKYKSDIQYILIPEQHKDGAWHIHGLIKGISEQHLINFDNIPNAPKKLKNKEYYNFTLYSKKFGFCSLGKIRDIEKVSSYITKYINKNLGQNIELGNKTYYATRGLKKAQTIKKGHLVCPLEYDFENDYCKIKNTTDITNIIINEIE